MNLLKHNKVHTDMPGKRRIRDLEDEYAKLWQMYGDMEDERDRLQEAIEIHRRNIWGDGCEVGHYEDEELYAALQEDRTQSAKKKAENAQRKAEELEVKVNFLVRRLSKEDREELERKITAIKSK